MYESGKTPVSKRCEFIVYSQFNLCQLRHNCTVVSVPLNAVLFNCTCCYYGNPTCCQIDQEDHLKEYKFERECLGLDFSSKRNF